VENSEDFYQSALAFGNFQRLLADYPAETLHETIKGFHDTKARFEVFKKAVADDVCGRAASVQKEIDFYLAHEELANVFGDMLANGEVPLRVTHNDTKLNNVMIDDATRKGICVIDLDTVMPGLAMNDFGDSIRFGASTAVEDEKDLDKVWCDMELFDAYAKGFIEGCGGKLTAKEIEALPMGAKVMTFECGMRFLTDYLQGDVYFKVHREGHNLDRTRTHIKLIQDMEEKWEVMKAIVKKYNA
jgi:Ser/Thr protein kinase RdoA (MazF antagonist)